MRESHRTLFFFPSTSAYAKCFGGLYTCSLSLSSVGEGEETTVVENEWMKA